jgi:hypothetical protein
MIKLLTNFVHECYQEALRLKSDANKRFTGKLSNKSIKLAQLHAHA